jgi:hypothetical protein
MYSLQAKINAVFSVAKSSILGFQISDRSWVRYALTFNKLYWIVGPPKHGIVLAFCCRPYTCRRT